MRGAPIVNPSTRGGGPVAASTIAFPSSSRQVPGDYSADILQIPRPTRAMVLLLGRGDNNVAQFKHSIGDVETRCPRAPIFCRTLAAERFNAVIRWVL